MATDSEPRPFDVATVEHLISLMATHDLAEIVLREGDQVIRLNRGGAPVMNLAPAPVAMAAPMPSAAAAPTAPAGKKLLEIKSEFVGTVYLKPKPDKDDYVKIGSRIKADTTICQMEAMKVFNEIKAGIAGTIAEVCVTNGDVAQYGTVLFRVDPGV